MIGVKYIKMTRSGHGHKKGGGGLKSNNFGVQTQVNVIDRF